MTASTAPARARFQGAVQIVRFNWPWYAAAVVLVAVGVLILETVSLDRRIAAAVLAGVGLAVFWLASSVVVSHAVYDRSAIASGGWLGRTLPGKPRTIANFHAGLDETSPLLSSQFPAARLSVFCFYDDQAMKRGVDRARSPSVTRGRGVRPHRLRADPDERRRPLRCVRRLLRPRAARRLRPARVLRGSTARARSRGRPRRGGAREECLERLRVRTGLTPLPDPERVAAFLRRSGVHDPGRVPSHPFRHGFPASKRPAAAGDLMTLVSHLRFAGALLLALAAMHVFLPTRLKWNEELDQTLPPEPADLPRPHVLRGSRRGRSWAFCRCCSPPCSLNPLRSARLVLAGLHSVLGSAPRDPVARVRRESLEREPFHTVAHVAFTALWAYLSVVYGMAFWAQLKPERPSRAPPRTLERSRPPARRT